MALVKCKECGNENAKDAKTCPKCGTSLQKRESAVLKILYVVIGAVVVTVGVVVAIGVLRQSPATDVAANAVEQVAVRANTEVVAPAFFASHGADLLKCFHPTGNFTDVGPVTNENADTATADIHWKGGIIGTPYVTTVRAHFSSSSVIGEIVTDSATIPAVNRSCPFTRQ